MDPLLVETIDGEPLELDKARRLSKRDKLNESSCCSERRVVVASQPPPPQAWLLTCLAAVCPAVVLFAAHTVPSRVCMPAMALGRQRVDVLAGL